MAKFTTGRERERNTEYLTSEKKRPKTSDEYLQKVFWDQTSSTNPTGCLDLGWTRPARVPTSEEVTVAYGPVRRFGYMNQAVSDRFELRCISVKDLRMLLKVEY